MGPLKKKWYFIKSYSKTVQPTQEAAIQVLVQQKVMALCCEIQRYIPGSSADLLSHLEQLPSPLCAAVFSSSICPPSLFTLQTCKDRNCVRIALAQHPSLQPIPLPLEVSRCFHNSPITCSRSKHCTVSLAAIGFFKQIFENCKDKSECE